MRQAIAIAISCVIGATIVRVAPAPNLPRFETKYYTIYTDLGRDDVAEVTVHLNKMAEVYTERTRGFAGAIRGRLPFALFKNADDYYAAGGARGSSGLFTGQYLMAVAGETLNNRTWHTVQHEGFHQFAAAVIGGDLPIWADEGLAEYFGEGLFTGDDIFTGVIPEWRRKRIVERMSANGYEPLDRFMRLTLEQWNNELSVINYDQAWSMVQFLAHGEGGKYQPAFVKFMSAISRHKGHTEAWNSAFGDARNFEARWRDYWLKMPENPTDDIYHKATLSALSSYLGRAFAMGQDFDSMEDFSKAASEDSLRILPAEFLPRTLLASTMEQVGKYLEAGDAFRIEHGTDKKHTPRIVLTMKSGAAYVGKFELRDKHVTRVTIDQPTAAPAAPPGAPRRK